MITISCVTTNCRYSYVSNGQFRASLLRSYGLDECESRQECRLRSTGMPEVDEYAASLVSRMASVTTHEGMLRSQAVSHMMTSVARGSPRLREAAVQGLASIANSPRGGDDSMPRSPLKVVNPVFFSVTRLQNPMLFPKQTIMLGRLKFAASD